MTAAPVRADRSHRTGPDAGTVSRGLAGRVRDLVRDILPQGRLDRLHGDEWCVAGVHGAAPSKAGSCRVHLRGEKAGVWSDFSTGEAGDALDLVAAVLYRGDKKQAYAWALNWLGLRDGAAPQTQQAYTPPPRDPAAAEAEDAKRRASALRLWLEARPSIAGTPADAYLRARGIDLSTLGRQPRALRFHPACWCEEAGQKLPALVAAITDADGHAAAVHRTYLGQLDGVWRKAQLRDAKKTFGRPRGGTIRLWRGASGKSLREAPAGESVSLGEGIETCLSVAVACPELRVLCGVSLANMASVVLPECVTRVVLLADNDGQNEAAARGLQRVINHFATTIHDVRIARAPVGKDFNDCLRH